MFRVCVVLISVCVVLGFMFLSLNDGGKTILAGKLNAVAIFALYAGVPYGALGAIIGWHYVQRLDPRRSKWNAFLVATPVHLISSLVAFYVIPSIIILLPHPVELAVSIFVILVFMGIPQIYLDYFLLQWLFELPLRKEDVKIIAGWKGTTAGMFVTTVMIAVFIPLLILVAIDKTSLFPPW